MFDTMSLKPYIESIMSSVKIFFPYSLSHTGFLDILLLRMNIEIKGMLSKQCTHKISDVSVV